MHLCINDGEQRWLYDVLCAIKSYHKIGSCAKDDYTHVDVYMDKMLYYKRFIITVRTHGCV